jgi:putative SOS response-associated peptidase YedK
MCGRYGFGNPARLAELPLGVTLPPLAPRFNVAPTQDVPLVLQEGADREARLARWGLVPFWADDPSIGNKLFNARGDTVAEKPSFRAAFKARRGLLPAEFFYEWQAVEGQKARQPWCVAVDDGEPFAFGALWERWRPKGEPDAEPLVSCTIITTDPNETMARIHHRMPLILPREAYDTWLDPRTPVEEAKRLVRPYEGTMRVWKVSTRVNRGAEDGAELVRPVD